MLYTKPKPKATSRTETSNKPTKGKKKDKKEEEPEEELKDDTPEGYMERAKNVLQTKFHKKTFLTGTEEEGWRGSRRE